MADNPGGAGVLIYHAVKQALAEGLNVHVIILTDPDTHRKANQDLGDLPGKGRLRIHRANDFTNLNASGDTLDPTYCEIAQFSEMQSSQFMRCIISTSSNFLITMVQRT